MRFQILISRYQLIYRPPLLLKLQTCWFPLWIRYGTWKAELIQFTTIRVNWSIWQRSSWNSEEMWKFPCISQFVDDKWVRTQYLFLWGFPDGTSGKESTSQCRRLKRHELNPWLGKSPIGKIPWRRAWQPTPAFLPRESHGQRSLAGYSPWGRKESGTTEAT